MSYSKGIMLALGIALLIGYSAADAAMIRKVHPGIFITRESTPALKERIQTTHASSWRMVKETADWSVALACDWCYGRLTDDERRMAAHALLEMNRFLETIRRFDDFSNHFVLEKVSASRCF